MKNKKQIYAIKEELSAFGQDNFSNILSLMYKNKKLWRASKKLPRRLTFTYYPQLLQALTLANKIKIKSELVRFNFI